MGQGFQTLFGSGVDNKGIECVILDSVKQTEVTQMKNYTEQDKQAIDWIFKNMDKMGIVEIPFGSEFRYVRQFLAKCRCPVYDAVFSQRGRVDVDYANCYEWITEWTEIV